MFAEMVARAEESDDDTLVAQLRSVEARRRELEAEQAAVLAELDRRKVYGRDGHASMWGLLRSAAGWSNGECRVRMRIARLVAEFADAGEALWETSVPLANIAEIARGFANPRCGSQIESVIGTLLNEAQGLEYDDFRRLVQRWEMLADVDGAHREREASHQARNAHLGVFDGVGQLVAQWGDVDGVQNLEIFQRFCDAEFAADWEVTKERHGDDACKALMPRTDAQRRADALSAIFRAAASTPPGSKAPEPVLNIVADHHTVLDLLAMAGLLPERFTDPWEDLTPLVTDRRCETTSGVPIDPLAVLQVAIEGHIRRVIIDDDGAVIDWGRKKRLFEGAARDAVMFRSPRCIHPGCRVRTGRCQADHLTEYSNGGHTRTTNGAPMCGRHNRFKHHGYTAHQDSRGHWHILRPDGTPIS